MNQVRIGIAGIGNMLLSAWTGATIELPLDGELYARGLEARIAASPHRTDDEARAP